MATRTGMETSSGRERHSLIFGSSRQPRMQVERPAASAASTRWDVSPPKSKGTNSITCLFLFFSSALEQTAMSAGAFSANRLIFMPLTVMQSKSFCLVSPVAQTSFQGCRLQADGARSAVSMTSSKSARSTSLFSKERQLCLASYNVFKSDKFMIFSLADGSKSRFLICFVPKR